MKADLDDAILLDCEWVFMGFLIWKRETCGLLKNYFLRAILRTAFTTLSRPELDRMAATSVWVKGKNFPKIAAAINSCGSKLAFIFRR